MTSDPRRLWPTSSPLLRRARLVSAAAAALFALTGPALANAPSPTPRPGLAERPPGRASPRRPSAGARVEITTTTSDLAAALSRRPDRHFSSRRPSGLIIDVNDRVGYQRFKGVGAAITDSAAWLIEDELDPTTRARVMDKLFGSSGAGLSFIRIPIGASDFTAGRVPYSYDDFGYDPGLTHFSIGHDGAYILPLAREALARSRGAYVLADLWSPPAWMKSNGRLDNVRHSGRVPSRFFAALARYLVRFLLDYQRSGVPVSALSPQNEPGIATSYPGAELSVSAEAAFVGGYLVPALRTAGLRTQVYGYDSGWASWSIPFAVSLAQRSVARELAGIATHCYFGSPSTISRLHYINPSLDQIVSECSPGITPYPTSELLIASMRNWATAVSLWNLALDPQGQPVQAPNRGCPRCTGLVTVDEARHSAALTLDYYQLGQMSKFVRPGAVRLASNHYVSYRYLGPGRDIATPGLDDVAFRNPDGSEVLVVYNGATAARTFTLRSRGRYVSDVLAARETATLVWDGPRGRS